VPDFALRELSVLVSFTGRQSCESARLLFGGDWLWKLRRFGMPGTDWARGFGFQESLDQSIRREIFVKSSSAYTIE
jgi:hypothetical protein